MEQVRFCNSGSEACLFAAQLARHATERPALLVFNGCYHGGFMTYGAKDPPLSVPLPLVKATYNDVPGTRALLRAHASELAAVMVEPMMGSAGCIPGSPEFLAMLREETQKIGALLVFDEVMTSRLAPGGVQGLRQVKPDSDHARQILGRRLYVRRLRRKAHPDAALGFAVRGQVVARRHVQQQCHDHDGRIGRRPRCLHARGLPPPQCPGRCAAHRAQ